MTSAKVVLWFSVVTGFGWFSYFAIPVAITNTALFAQGVSPDWSLKDMANLGGFAVFSIAMFFLHRESIKTFRDELKAERESREKHTEKFSGHMEAHTAGILANTQATTAMTLQLSELTREMRKG